VQEVFAEEFFLQRVQIDFEGFAKIKPKRRPAGSRSGCLFCKSQNISRSRRTNCAPHIWMNSGKIPVQQDNFVIKDPEELRDRKNREVQWKFWGRSLCMDESLPCIVRL
jgi:hypothetical protein